MKQFIFTFILLFVATLMSAQTTTTRFTKTLSIEKLDNINNQLVGNVEVVHTNSQRILIETTITVTHPKSTVISKFIVDNNLLSTQVVANIASRTTTLRTPELKSIIVDGKDAEVHTSYLIHLPNNLNIR